MKDMWMVAGANKKLDGPLGSYNTLTDPYLCQYFNNCTLQKHLVNMGLIRRDGSVIPETLCRQRHQNRIRKQTANEELATAIVKKTLDIERMRQAEIQRHLDELTKIELVERVKSARSSGRHWSAPPVPQGRKKKIVYNRREQSAPSVARHSYHKKFHSSRDCEQWNKSIFKTNCDLRPISAPISEDLNTEEFNEEGNTGEQLANQGKCLSRIQLNRPKSAHPKHRMPVVSNQNSLYEPLESKSVASEQALFASSLTFHPAISPYLHPLLQDLNGSFKPRPPSRSYSRALRPKIGDNMDITIRDLLDWNSQDQLHVLGSHKRKKRKTVKNSVGKTRSKSAISTCSLTWRYLGNPLLKSISSKSQGQEVTIFQQHCGGSNILLYRGRLFAGEIFTFPSRRVQGYPFSVTLFLDGVRDLRLSTCCESRHPVGARLGGASGHFQVVAVNLPEKTHPCLRCEAEQCLGLRTQFPLSSGSQKAVSLPSHSVVLVGPQNVPRKRAVSVDVPKNTRPKTPDVAEVLELDIYPQQGLSHIVLNSNVEDEIHTESEVEEIMERASNESDNISEEGIVKKLVHPYKASTESPSHRACGDNEDQVCGDYQCAEYNAESDVEIDDESDQSDQEAETGEDADGEDEVFVDHVTSQQENEEQTPAPGPKSKAGQMTISRSCVRLPDSHWGARQSPQTGSFSSDEGQPVNTVTKVQADVHVNASRNGSIASYQ